MFKQILLRSALLLMLSLLLLVSVSCGDGPDGPGEGTASLPASTDAPATEPDYSAYSVADATSAYPDRGAVLTMTSPEGSVYEIPFDYYHYFQQLYKYYFDRGDDAYWTANPEMETRVRTQYVEELLRNCVIEEYCKAHGLMPTEAEEKALLDDAAEYLSGFGSAKALDDALAANDMNRFTYRYLTLCEEYTNRASQSLRDTGEILTSEADIRAYADTDAFIRCKHILIANDAGEDPEENRAKAEELLSRLQNGEDFDALCAEFGEDPGMQANPDGYYFFRGEMEEHFEEASFALADGEMSGVVESSFGFHIILRCEKDPAYLDANISEIASKYASLRYNQILADLSSGWTVSRCAEFETYEKNWSTAG